MYFTNLPMTQILEPEIEASPNESLTFTNLLSIMTVLYK